MSLRGPTGSGKTTTLYAALSELNDPQTKILTAEDPVEYDIDGLVQCQVNTDQELTFGKLLRSFLRQDPDVILVGEIRDLETAQIAVQASLTGHLVFTWHCTKPSMSYSTGSSAVRIFVCGSFNSDNAAYKVVVLPDPVGPVTTTIPFGRRMMSVIFS